MINIEEYIPILIFFIMAIIMSLGAIFMSFVFGEKEPYFEKTSTYECGFEPFSDTGKFDVQFYLVAILFIIFDLEIIFMFHWAVATVDLEPGILVYDVFSFCFNHRFYL